MKEAPSNVRFDRESLKAFRVHRFCIILVVIFPLVLRMIHGCICILEERIDLFAVDRVDRDADTSGCENFVCFNDQRSCYGVQQPLGHFPCILAVADVGEEYSELIPSDASERRCEFNPFSSSDIIRSAKAFA